MGKIRIGVVTVSDRCSRGTVQDLSGPAVACVFSTSEFELLETVIVPDEHERIVSALLKLVDHDRADVVLTTGGTGFGPRDVTPEATAVVLNRIAPGIIAFLLRESIDKTPFAALSRATAGIRRSTLIVNLPGSPKAADELSRALVPIIPHAVHVMLGGSDGHK